ncbi:MAG: PilZ domain-containing protein [Candidatus Omnitrophota bacterium]|jgi:c-di-GMP-binding flagellar brake protein YcgR
MRNRFVEDLLGCCGFHGKDEILQNRLMRYGIDRRRFPRVECHHLAKCCYINENRRDWITNLKDISEGGLRLWTPERIECQDIVKFVIFFAQMEREVTVAAKMVWRRRLQQDGPGYMAGFSFLDVETHHLQFLHSYTRANRS